ncbi:hypothetical protein HanRHA438_Chr10g0455801 [Helianthus annuus]|nr:hypothetical protein HanRHA438_Chr10g0455801 [Helianthus annuus]
MTDTAAVTSFKTGIAGTFLDQVQTSCGFRSIHDILNNLQQKDNKVIIWSTFNTKSQNTYMCNALTPHPLTISLQLLERRSQSISGLNSSISPLFRCSHAGCEVCNRDLPGLNFSISKSKKQFTQNQ